MDALSDIVKGGVSAFAASGTTYVVSDYYVQATQPTPASGVTVYWYNTTDNSEWLVTG